MEPRGGKLTRLLVISRDAGAPVALGTKLKFSTLKISISIHRHGTARVKLLPAG